MARMPQSDGAIYNDRLIDNMYHEVKNDLIKDTDNTSNDEACILLNYLAIHKKNKS